MKEITPPNFMCHTDNCCPAIFETDQGSYIIIGKKLDEANYNTLSQRIASDEYVVEVPQGLIEQLYPKRLGFRC